MDYYMVQWTAVCTRKIVGNSNGGLHDSGPEVQMPHCELCRKNPDSQKYFHAGEKLPHQNAINSETFLREVSSSECNQRLALLVECLSFQVEHPAAARKCSTHSPLRSAKYWVPAASENRGLWAYKRTKSLCTCTRWRDTFTDGLVRVWHV